MAQSNHILTSFGQCTRALIELLHDNRQLEPVEQMFIENHLALLRAAYEGWKRRSAGPST